MRTYIRKKLQVQEIENVQSLCRLCLGKTEEMISIFDPNVEDNIFSGLHMRIGTCLGLEVSRDDVFPKLICQLCNTELEKFYTFKKSCTATYRKLKACLFKIKHTDRNKNNDLSNQGKTVSTPVSGNIDKSNVNVRSNPPQSFDHSKLVVELPRNSSQMNEKNVHEGKVILHEKDLVGSTGANSNPEVRREKEDCHNTPVCQSSELKVEANQSGEINEILDVVKTRQEATKDASHISGTIQCLPDYIVTNLIEKGVLARRDSALEILDHNIKTFTMETPCGNQFIMELVEEDPIRPAIEYNKSSHPKIFESNSKSDGGGGCCGACGLRCRSRGALARHERVHSGERPFVCRACGRRFAQQETLRRHQLLHADKLPFQCSRCPKSYTQRGALVAHARSHAPPSARALVLHRCTRCPKVFLYPSGLSRHMSVHAGREYPCDECPRTFSDKSSLQRHRRAHQRRQGAPPTTAMPTTN